MLKRTWVLIALVYLAIAEGLSLLPVPDLSLCLIQPEYGEQASNHDGEKYCPAFHTGAALAFEKTDHWLERHDKSVIGAFTIVLAISTIGLWLATNKLWLAGEKQIRHNAEIAAAQARDTKETIDVARNDFVATHRPWVSVAISIGERGLYFNENGANLHLIVHCKNIGKTPALNVRIECRPYMAINQHALTEQRLVCEEASKRPNDPRMLGTTIFPDDQHLSNITYTFISKVDLEQTAASLHGFIRPMIVGCIDYQFSFGSGDRRQTGFIYEVRKRDLRAIKLADGDAADLTIFKSYEAGGFFAT